MLKITNQSKHIHDLKSFKFPVGEINVCFDSNVRRDVNFDFEYVFDGSDSIVELLLSANAVKSMGGILNRLTMDYVPFSRQDRIMNKGESFSLKVFCDLINNLGFKEVCIKDPHSDVTPALLSNCVVTSQCDVMAPVIRERFCSEVDCGHKEEYTAREPFYLVSPDGGALKKIYKLAEKVSCLGVIECSKKRDVTNGKITGVTVSSHDHKMDDYHWEKYTETTHIIVDDVSDGGFTFIQLSKAMRNIGITGKIVLMVTHGFFTKGIDIFPDINHIWCSNKGWVK